MKQKHILPSALLTFFFAALSLLLSCTDETSTLGVDMMPSSDTLRVFYDTYATRTGTYEVTDPILARTSTTYLGRFTDPETGTSTQADFIAQYHITESDGGLFPDNIIDNKITSMEIRLYISDFIGDSLASFKLSVYDLNKGLDSNADFYTNIDPTEYYDVDAEPLASKWYTLSDRILDKNEREEYGYKRSIRISLPSEVGQKIYDAYREDKSKFASTYMWLNSGLPCSKGLYFKLEYGEGAIAYVTFTEIRINFKSYDEYGLETGYSTSMSSTEEVIEVTNFESSDLSSLASDETCTYLKSPAGLFTVVTLPIDQLSETDTINSASISFTRYNDKVQSPFKLGIPETLLMVRYDDYKDGFFEKNYVANDRTSYVTTFSNTGNTYTFSNIARLVSTCLSEKKSGTNSENYDKVLLIPVVTTYDTTNKLVQLNHDFSFNQAKLVKDATLNVIYSRFGN